MKIRQFLDCSRRGLLLLGILFNALILSSPATAGSISTDPGFRQFMEEGGDWLLPLQQPSGAFPWTSTDPDGIFVNVQAPIGFGLLSAWQATGREDFRDASIAVADWLIANQAQFDSGLPRFRSYDAYFFVRLSNLTGIPTYLDHARTFFFDRLEAGIYGPDDDWDIVDFVAAEIARRGAQAPVGEVVAAWDLALATVAANEAGISQFNPSLAAGVREALADAPDETFILGDAGFDVLGLAGGVWAAGITGLSVAPTAGLWADVTDNQGLAQALLGFQSGEGGFLQSSLALSDPIDPTNTVSQQTAFALLGLQALGGQQFAPQLRQALASLIAFQFPDGKISYFHPNVDLETVNTNGDVLNHAYALQAFSEIQDDVAPPPVVPVPALNRPALILLTIVLAIAGLFGTRAFAGRLG